MELYKHKNVFETIDKETSYYWHHSLSSCKFCFTYVKSQRPEHIIFISAVSRSKETPTVR